MPADETERLPVITGEGHRTIDRAHAARRDETLTLWATGCGNEWKLPDYDKTPDTGLVMSQYPRMVIGGFQATVLWSGLAPGYFGLCQINFRLPAGLSTGAHPMEIGLMPRGAGYKVWVGE